MHPFEALIPAISGMVFWMIATDRFPADPEARRRLEIRLPLVKNKKLLWGMSMFSWVFTLAIFWGLVT